MAPADRVRFDSCNAIVGWHFLLSWYGQAQPPTSLLSHVCTAKLRAQSLLSGTYVKKRLYVGAYGSHKCLRNHEEEAARHLYYITAQIDAEAAVVDKANYFKRFRELPSRRS